MPNEKLKALYDGVSQDYNIGTFEEFSSKLADPEKRKAFYDGVGSEYNLGTYDEFSSKVLDSIPEKKKGLSLGYSTPQEAISADSKNISPSPLKSTSPSGEIPKVDLRAKVGEDQIIPKVEVPKLPKYSREQMYTSAQNKHIDLYKKTEAALAPLMPSIDMAIKISNGEVEATPEEKQKIFQDYQKAEPYLKQLQESADKIEYYDQALKGNHQLKVMGTDSGFKNRFVNSGLSQLGSLALNALSGTADIVKYVNQTGGVNKVMEDLSAKFSKEADKEKARADYYSALMDEKDNYLNKDVTDIYKEKGIVGATEYAAKKFTESLPTTLGIMGLSLTGAAIPANAGLFLGSAKDRYKQVEGIQGMSDSDKLTNAIGYGTAELLFEGLLSSGMASVYKQMIKQVGKDQAEKLIRKNMIDVITNGVKKYMPLSGGFVEGLGEAATTATQNLVDKYTNPESKDKNVMDGVVDAFAIGAVGGSGMSAPISGVSKAANVVGYVNKLANKNKIAKLAAEKNAIDSQLQNPELSQNTVSQLKEASSKNIEKQNDIAIEDRKVLSDKMTDTQREAVKVLSNEVNNTIDAINEVSDETTKSTLAEKQSELQNDIDLIYDNAGSEKPIKGLSKEAQNQIAKLEQLKQKEVQNDNQENQQGLPSEIGVGQKPIETEPIKTPSGETPSAGGILQAQEEIKPIKVAGTEVVEHGEDINTQEDLENGVKPTELTERGKNFAQRLGQKVKELGKKLIVTSGVERAKETGKIASETAGVPTEVNENLNTWNIGEFDGKPSGEFDEEYYINNPDEKVKGGESFNDFKNRMQKAYKEVKAMPSDVQVVAHSKVMDAFKALDKGNGKWTKQALDEYSKLRNSAKTQEVQTEVKSSQIEVSEKETASQKAIKSLEKLKVDTKNKTFDAVLGIPVAVYNGAIDVAINAIKAGEAISKAVEKAVKYAKDNFADTKEAEFTQHLKEQLGVDIVAEEELKALEEELNNAVTKTKKAQIQEKINKIKESGRSKSYKEGRVPVSKTYAEAVASKNFSYEEMDMKENAQKAVDYLDSFNGNTSKPFTEIMSELNSDSLPNPTVAVAAELLADRLFAKGVEENIKGNNEKAQEYFDQSEALLFSAFEKQRKAGQYNAALGVFARSNNPDAFKMFVNKQIDKEYNSERNENKRKKVTHSVDKFKKSVDKAKSDAIEETVKSVADKKAVNPPNEKFENLKKRGLERQKKALEKLGKIGFLGSNGLSNEAIEAIGELALSQIELGIYKLSTIANKIKLLTDNRVTDEHLKEVFSDYKFEVDGVETSLDEYSKRIESELQSAKEKANPEKVLEKRAKESVKPEEGKKLSLSDLVKKNLEGAPNVETLAAEIQQEFGVSEKEANRLANAYISKYKSILSEKIDKALKKELGIKNLDEINRRENAGEIKPVEKTLGGKIVSQVLAGALDTEVLRQAFSVKYGLPTITPTIANNIRLLAQKVNNATTTIGQRAAIKNLLTYVQSNVPTNVMSVLNSLYYVSLLSGVTTALVNTAGNANVLINQRFENLIESIGDAIAGDKSNLIRNPIGKKSVETSLKNMWLGVLTFADIMQHGGGETKYYNLNQKGLSNFDSERMIARRKDFQKMNLPKILKTIGKLYYTIPTWINRNLSASDEAFYSANFNIEAVREVRRNLYKKGLRGAALESATFQEVYGTEQIQVDALLKAQQEMINIGIDPAKRKKMLKRIAHEIIQKNLDERVQRVANTVAAENTYRGAYRGATGAIAQYIPQTTLFSPFITTVVKIAERNFDYIPIYGNLRQQGLGLTDLLRRNQNIDKWFERKGIDKAQRSGEMKYKQVARNVLSYAVMGTLYALTKMTYKDDDGEEKPIVEISGGYFGVPYEKRKELEKIMPSFSMKIMGTTLSYKQNPLLAMAALPIAISQDLERYGKDKEFADKLKNYGASLSLYLLESTPLQSIDEFFKSLRDVISPDSDKSIEDLAKTLGKTFASKAFVVPEPNTYKQFFDFLDPRKFDANSTGDVLWKAANMEAIGELIPTHDVWGKPVEFYPGETFFPFHQWMKESHEDDVEKWAIKTNITIPRLNRKTLVLASDEDAVKSYTLKDWEEKKLKIQQENDEMSDAGIDVEKTLNYKVLTYQEWSDMDAEIRKSVYNIVNSNFNKVVNAEQDEYGEYIIQKPFKQMDKKEGDKQIRFWFNKYRMDYINKHFSQQFNTEEE